MPNSIVINPVKSISESVLNRLLTIEHACFSEPWSPAMFVISKMEGIITAETGDKTVGFACFQHFLDECHILNVAVLPAFRKQGIGRQLVEWLFTRLTEAKDFFLEVRESNRTAISLYESMGFQIIGERKEYYRDKENALVMHKKNKWKQG
ncbi:MAG: ribosomal protein S18-alanine N-acetyltransferase [Acidobacteria bacterium]|nr:ribosomal protein S18-alanine N-acetyltransferase [Acidobacteriota bacterium]